MSGGRAAKPLLLQGLQRLEYRGYDSAGIALLEEDGLEYVRAVGNLAFLKEAAGSNGSDLVHRAGPYPLGDPRRGERTERPPAPRSCDGRTVAIVHNGIVENYQELRRRAVFRRQYVQLGDQHTEVLAHLIEHTPKSKETCIP